VKLRSRLSPASASLLAILAFYTVLLIYLAELRYESFYTQEWDLGIFMQALWSTLHGRLLYDAGDYVTFHTESLLIIHPALILLPLSLIYGLYPHAITLFVIQALAVASSAVPLYMIGERFGASRPALIGAIVVYLLNPFLLGSYFYDFHLEAFLPLESFSLFYLLMRRRYGLAAVVFILGVFTLEIFPFIALFMAIYFAYDRFGIGMLAFWRRIRDGTYRMYLYFAAAAVLSYVMLRFIEHGLVPALVTPTDVQGNTIGLVWRQIIYLFMPSAANYQQIVYSVAYWLLLYASFGFLAFRHPKHLIIALPLLYFSIILMPYFAQYMGFQYGFIFIIPVAIGSIIGLSRLKSGRSASLILSIALILLYYSVIYPGARAFIFKTVGVEELLALLLAPAAIAAAAIVSEGRAIPGVGAQRGRRNLRVASLLLAVLVVLAAADFTFSPLNPNANAPNPPWGSGYTISYHANPAYKYMHDLLSYYETNETVVASSFLFPYVANNLNSYPGGYGPSTFKYLPFKETNLPQYILVDAFEFNQLPSCIQNALVNESFYGLRAWIVSSSPYPGSIMLFQLGYSGSPAIYTAEPLVFDYRNLDLGQGSILVRSNSSPSYYIYEPPNHGGYATMWYGPYTLLPPGTYRANFLIKSVGNYSGYLLTLDVATNLGREIIASEPLYGYELAGPGKWTNVSIEFTLTHVTPLVELRGIWSSGATSLYLANITLEPMQVPGNTTVIFPWQLKHSPQMRIAADGSLVGEDLGPQTAWYGPYIGMQPGLYLVRYNMNSSGASPSDKMQIEVTADYGNVTLYTSPLCAAHMRDGSEFYLLLNGSYSAVEFKAYVYNWSGPLALENITITRLPSSALPLAIHQIYYPCELDTTGAGALSDGVIRAVNAAGTMVWYGPYTTLYPGIYDVTFALNSSGAPADSTLYLQVTANDGSVILREVKVTGAEISGPTPITIPLTLNQTEQYVEFRGYAVNWEGPLELDYIELNGTMTGGVPARRGFGSSGELGYLAEHPFVDWSEDLYRVLHRGLPVVHLGRIAHEPPDRLDHLLRRVRVDQGEPQLPVRRYRGGYDRGPAEHRLHDRLAERVLAGRGQQDVRR